MKNISYSSHANKTPFHHRDFALTLVLKVRVFVTVGKEEKVGPHYKPQARFSGDSDVERRDLRIFLKGEAPSLLF